MSDNHVGHEYLQRALEGIRDDMAAVVGTLREDIRQGFADVRTAQGETNAHLMRLNSKTEKLQALTAEHETVLGRHDERIKTLFIRVGWRRGGQTHEQGDPPSKDAINRRDLKVVGLTLGAIGGAITFAFGIWPFLRWLLRAAVGQP